MTLHKFHILRKLNADPATTEFLFANSEIHLGLPTFRKFLFVKSNLFRYSTFIDNRVFYFKMLYGTHLYSYVKCDM